jgi:type I restriction-modification system DNA methylase subunit
MDNTQAKTLVQDTLRHVFDKARYQRFIREIVNRFDESKATAWGHQYIKDAFKPHVERYERLGTYTSPDRERVDLLIIYLTQDTKLQTARTALRNFVAHHLKQRDEKDAALAAFVSPSEHAWRFSFVKMKYATEQDEQGKVSVSETLTPARRYSYLVGEGESCHTAQSRFLGLLRDSTTDPSLEQIEDAFSVETVTKEFYEQYSLLFESIKNELDKLLTKDAAIRAEFKQRSVSTVDFSKKLLGQIVFLYFIQKKGWLGVPKGEPWGQGPRDFLRRLVTGQYGAYKNFFNDVLEPLFFDTLATDRGHDAWCDRFKSRIPFLNGGLFEPLGDYDWKHTDILLPNDIFTNRDHTTDGDLGTGVLDIFDRYNFTVNEAEPLEQEVAIDPEMLGKVFENLIEENRRKGFGTFYTPREIVHYMCQESLVQYLYTALNPESEPIVAPPSVQDGLFTAPKPLQSVLHSSPTRETISREDLEALIRSGEQAAHYEAARKAGTVSYRPQLPPSIEANARLIDEKLRDITVCDPAIGSGAFPVGMMTEIVRARLSLTPYFNAVPERTPYHFKRHAIHHSLYGVDIDPGAVEIAKLRLWLSLVVDEDEVKQIKPLPNLDYKVVVGNSLLGFPFRSHRLSDIEKLKDRLFNEIDHAAKAQLKKEIDDKLTESILASARSLGYDVSFDFETWFSEVFREHGGFDVVIANPPYVDSETMVRNDAAARALIAKLYTTTRGNWDLYIPFWELGLRKLNKNGTATFITPNKWLSIGYGEALRHHCAPYVYHIVDYSKFRAFENVGVFPVVMLMSKRRPSDLTVRRFMENQRLVFARTMPTEYLVTFSNWGVLLSPYLPLVLTIVSDRPKLSLVCHAEEAFTVSEAYELPKIMEEWTPSKDAYLRFINTGTIDPYVNLWGRKQTTYLKTKYIKPVVDPARFQVDFPRRYAQSANTKIIISGIRHFESFLDSDGTYIAGKSTVVLRDFKEGYSPEYLLGLLNSKVVKFFLKECYGSLAMDGGINFSPHNVSEIPIAQCESKLKREIVAVVARILKAKASDVESDIEPLQKDLDDRVARLYGLAAQDIAVLELP